MNTRIEKAADKALRLWKQRQDRRVNTRETITKGGLAAPEDRNNG